MQQEITILDTMLKSVLTLDKISEIITFNTDEQLRGGKSERSPGKHFHELFEMRMLFQCGADDVVDYSQIKDICMTPPQVIHGGLFPHELNQHISLRLGADELYYLRGKEHIFSFALTPELRVPGVVYAELAAALSQCGQNKDQSIEHTRLLIAMFISTLRQLMAANKSAPLTPAEAIASCIRENYYRSTLSIREIAEMTDFSPNYLQKVFRAKWNCTPIEYLNEVRLNAAQQLLRQKRWMIKEVAAMCGWNYVHYFCRRYKEHFGHLPGEEK